MNLCRYILAARQGLCKVASHPLSTARAVETTYKLCSEILPSEPATAVICQLTNVSQMPPDHEERAHVPAVRLNPPQIHGECSDGLENEIPLSKPTAPVQNPTPDKFQMYRMRRKSNRNTDKAIATGWIRE